MMVGFGMGRQDAGMEWFWESSRVFDGHFQDHKLFHNVTVGFPAFR